MPTDADAAGKRSEVLQRQHKYHGCFLTAGQNEGMLPGDEVAHALLVSMEVGKTSSQMTLPCPSGGLHETANKHPLLPLPDSGPLRLPRRRKPNALGGLALPPAEEYTEAHQPDVPISYGAMPAGMTPERYNNTGTCELRSEFGKCSLEDDRWVGYKTRHDPGGEASIHLFRWVLLRPGICGNFLRPEAIGSIFCPVPGQETAWDSGTETEDFRSCGREYSD